LRFPSPRRVTAEKVKAPLSLHGAAAARLFKFSPSRTLLVPPAAHLLQGRAHRGGNQPALRDHQLRRAGDVFAFYNDRGECENRIEEFKNGFRADRLSCHRFLANAFRLLLHAFAYNLVNLFRLRQLPEPWRSTQIETLRARLFKIGARIRQTARCIRIHLATGWPWQALFSRLALALNTS
jgi:DDE family transposase